MEERKSRYTNWLTELRATRAQRAKDEIAFYARIAEFETDTDSWEWTGISFDRILKLECGISPDRYRAYVKAVRLIGHEMLLGLGMDVALRLRRFIVDDIILATRLYERVATRIIGFSATHDRYPSPTYIGQILREEAKRLGIVVPVKQKTEDKLQTAIGALRRIAEAKGLSRKEMQTIAAETLVQVDIEVDGVEDHPE